MALKIIAERYCLARRAGARDKACHAIGLAGSRRVPRCGCDAARQNEESPPTPRSPIPTARKRSHWASRPRWYPDHIRPESFQFPRPTVRYSKQARPRQRARKVPGASRWVSDFHCRLPPLYRWLRPPSADCTAQRNRCGMQLANIGGNPESRNPQAGATVELLSFFRTVAAPPLGLVPVVVTRLLVASTTGAGKPVVLPKATSAHPCAPECRPR